MKNVRSTHSPFRKYGLLTIAVAAALTCVATPLMNAVDLPLSREEPFLDNMMGTAVVLDSYLGISKDEIESDMSPECLANPKVARFLETIESRVRPIIASSDSSYDVMMSVPQYFAEGWPFETRAICAKVIIKEYKSGSLYCEHILLADAKGEPPERPEGGRANWLFYAALSLPLAWLLVRFAPIHGLRFNPAVLRVPAVSLLGIERRWHWEFTAASTLLLGCMGACYTHSNVITFQRAPFTGQFDDVYLNAMMGLPSDYLPEELDPLSGITPTDPQLIAFCQKLAEQARPYVKDHPSQCTVYVMLTSHTVRGWPFRSAIPAATLIIYDGSLGESNSREYEFEVDAEGNPAFKWPGAMGNTLIFAAAAFPLAWGFFALLQRLLRRLARSPHAFPVIMLNGEQPSKDANATS